MQSLASLRAHFLFDILLPFRRVALELREMIPAQHNEVTFSFVVPVYNEQEGLEYFYTRLKATADEMGEPYEIIFVDDGSQDETPSILRRLAKDDRCVRAVEFSRNFGHQVAISAGYDYASGRAVISLDSDCQHPPEMIPELVARWREGFEVVYTIRRGTAGVSRLRRAIGRGVYRIITAVTGADLTDQADFRLLDRKAVEALKQHRERARFVRGLVRWIGFRQTALPYVAGERAAGRSKYTLKQLARMAGAGVFNFSVRPLRLASLLGGTLLTAGVLYAMASLILWPFGLAADHWTHLLVLTIGMFGLQLLLLGILGEYVGRMFDEVKARPLYIVREKVGFAEETQKSLREGEERPEQQPQRYSVLT